MEKWQIFAIIGTLQISSRSETLNLDRMDSYGKIEILFKKIGESMWSPE